MAKKASPTHSEFYRRLTGSITEGLETLKAGKTLTTRMVTAPQAPKPLRPVEVLRLRKKLNVSQAVFAAMLNASVQTVRAWEQGLKQPSGPSLRLLEVARNHPEALVPSA